MTKMSTAALPDANRRRINCRFSFWPVIASKAILQYVEKLLDLNGRHVGFPMKTKSWSAPSRSEINNLLLFSTQIRYVCASGLGRIRETVPYVLDVFWFWM